MKIQSTPLNLKGEHSSERALWSWIWIVIFAIAFAWVESSIVVYLREIYFEGSFSFPLVIQWKAGALFLDKIMRIELAREIAAIVMLAAMSWVAGKNALQKFCFFMIAFGIWDIWYYIWLWIMVRWPEGFLTWDILFFIPLPWVGPVITPLLIAATMTAAGSLLIYYDEKGLVINCRWYDLLVESGCGLLIIAAFCWDWKNILRVPDGIPHAGVPNPFAWWLYLPAYLLSVLYCAARLTQILRAQRDKSMADP